MARQLHLTLDEVADEVGVHKRTIVRWIETGKVGVPKRKNRQGHYCFTKQDLAKLKTFSERIEVTD